MKRAASGSAASRGKRAASAAAIAAQQDESAVDIELAEAVATNGEDDPCPYDKQRNQNVARNKAYLMKLGLDDEKNKLDAAAAASKPVRKPKTKPPSSAACVPIFVRYWRSTPISRSRIDKLLWYASVASAARSASSMAVLCS